MSSDDIDVNVSEQESAENHKKINWLASYPKSGNTWFRAFISHLIKEDKKEFDLNNMDTHGIASARVWFDEVVGVESADMSWREQYIYRPQMFDWVARHAKKDLYIKAHDAYILNDHKLPVFPTEVTKLVVYIIRNPLDVAVSYAHHNGHQDISQSIEWMNDMNHGLCLNKNLLPNQLPQLMFTWSSHAKSWTKQKRLPVHVVRYEDMKLRPYETFAKVATAMGIAFTKQSLNDAIAETDFNKLKFLEERSGFRERSNSSESFFRKGEVGSWREELTDEQVRILIENHKEVMQEHGYLDSQDKPVF